MRDTCCSVPIHNLYTRAYNYHRMDRVANKSILLLLLPTSQLHEFSPIRLFPPCRMVINKYIYILLYIIIRRSFSVSSFGSPRTASRPIREFVKEETHVDRRFAQVPTKQYIIIISILYYAGCIQMPYAMIRQNFGDASE